MVHDDELIDQETENLNESNAERDQDHGHMYNGTIGGNMDVIGPAEVNEKEQGSQNRDQDQADKASKETSK